MNTQEPIVLDTTEKLFEVFGKPFESEMLALSKALSGHFYPGLIEVDEGGFFIRRLTNACTKPRMD